MANTGFFHHIGTFLLLAATILLLITSISSPVINDIGILRVKLTNSTSDGQASTVTFGSFGYCILHASGNTDFCTGSHIGYNPAKIMEGIDQTDFNTASTDTSKALTRVMVLHPVACVLAFIAFICAAGSGIIGAVFAAFLSAIAWLVAIVVMVTDFVAFGIIKRHVDRDGSGSDAYFSVGMWTLVAAMLCLFFATFIVLFTCCSSRMHRQNSSKHADAGYGNGTTTTKRHFWQRQSRY